MPGAMYIMYEYTTMVFISDIWFLDWQAKIMAKMPKIAINDYGDDDN